MISLPSNAPPAIVLAAKALTDAIHAAAEVAGKPTAPPRLAAEVAAVLDRARSELEALVADPRHRPAASIDRVEFNRMSASDKAIAAGQLLA